MDFKKVADRLDDIHEKFDRDVEELAEEVRQFYLKPLAEKYDLEYRAGNGTWAFFYKKLTLTPAYLGLDTPEGRAIKRFGLEPIFKILDLQVSSNWHLGFFVGDVQKGCE
jgi:hypothetical protein